MVHLRRIPNGTRAPVRGQGWCQDRVRVRMKIGTPSGAGLGLGLEEVFAFDSKSENRDRAVEGWG